MSSHLIILPKCFTRNAHQHCRPNSKGRRTGGTDFSRTPAGASGALRMRVLVRDCLRPQAATPPGGNIQRAGRCAKTTLGPPAPLGLRLDFINKLSGKCADSEQRDPVSVLGTCAAVTATGQGPSVLPHAGCQGRKAQATASSAARPSPCLDEHRHTIAHGQEAQSPRGGSDNWTINSVRAHNPLGNQGWVILSWARHKPR